MTGRPHNTTLAAKQRPGAQTLRTLSDRMYALRDRLLADPSFQRWSSAFPLTRPVARREAAALFDLCAGFVYSQVLLACVRLDLFAILAKGPVTLPELSQRLQLPLDATQRLLGAAAALRLATVRSDDRFGLGMLGAALLGNPAIAAMVEHHALLYSDLRDPVALLRGEAGVTQLAKYWPYAGNGNPVELAADDVAAYTALMSESQALVADDVLDAYPLTQHRCLLDAGGGDGTFLCAAGARFPNLQLMLLDLPSVAARATARFTGAGLAGRAKAHGGDFLAGTWPKGADVISLVRVLLDHNDDNAAAILRSARAALPAGGVVLIAEQMSGIHGAESVGDAYFAFYLLAMGRGRPRSPARHAALLSASGFKKIRHLRTRRPLQTSLIIARV